MVAFLCVVQTQAPGATWNEKQDRAVITQNGECGRPNLVGESQLGSPGNQVQQGSVNETWADHIS